jgi:hypothetical protein
MHAKAPAKRTLTNIVLAKIDGIFARLAQNGKLAGRILQ